ncbi:MAG: hypothetical protein ACEY3D_01975 [Rickettsia sp.]|uniref:hypothetical protein n=1 Tax=Rickettsia sp. TaxID=789 RepID=UPI00397B0695
MLKNEITNHSNEQKKILSNGGRNKFVKGLFLAALVLMVSEIASATTLETQLDKIGTLSGGKLKTIGISGATILSSIWAVVRGNIKLAGAIVAIGVILGLYLEWINAGMKVSM